MPALSIERTGLQDGDRAACDRMIASGSRSFSAASMLLPSRERRAARALYAFCRSSDDLVDEGGGQPSCAVESLAARIEAIYAGRPGAGLADRAFGTLVAEYGIPKEVPEAMIEGFAWDAEGRTYETVGEVIDYAARVASTVGIMMTLIMGRNDRAVLARAADLGIAMQLTNIARDVGEDAARGRLYLPRAWMRAEGLDPDTFLAAPRHSRQLARVVARLLASAETFYGLAISGTAGLPRACRPAILSAALIYRAIGVEIAANGFDSITRRAQTCKGAKLKLAVRALAMTAAIRSVDQSAPAAAAAFLVEAAARGRPQSLRGFDANFGRFIELLAAVEARERGLGMPEAVGAR